MWQSLPLFGKLVLVRRHGRGRLHLRGGARRGARAAAFLQAARLGAYGTVGLIGLAVLCLAYAFVTHDFRIRYVAHYSDRSMTAALPAHRALGRPGRLAPLVALPPQHLHRASACAGSRAAIRELQPYVIATLMVVILFFCVLMMFAANPFATSIAGARVDGEGLNPLLQNFYMIIHPPSLYTGFVGCSVPFAFAIAALVTGRLDNEWIVAVPQVDALRLAVPLDRQRARHALGLRRARLGRLLGLGSGRERGLPALAHGDRLRALDDDPGAARHAEGLERLRSSASRSS